MKDKNLRKQLYGFWHTQDREDGGPDLVLDNKWHISMSDGIVRHLLKEIDKLRSDVELLKAKSKIK